MIWRGEYRNTARAKAPIDIGDESARFVEVFDHLRGNDNIELLS